MQQPTPFSHYFSTNYVPNSSEADQITSLILEDEAQIAILDSNIEELMRKVETLEAEKTAHSERMDNHKKLISPVRRVPDDVLTSVFLCCKDLGRVWQLEGSLHQGSMENAPSTMPLPLPVILSHVCRLWRALLLDMPLMWTLIEVWFPCYPTLPIMSSIRYQVPSLNLLPIEGRRIHQENVSRWEENVRNMTARLCEYTARSRSCPLNISFHLQELGTDHFAEQVVSDAAGGIADILINSSARWRSLRLDLLFHKYPSVSTRMLEILATNLPLLKSLTIVDLGPAGGFTTVPANTWEELLRGIGAPPGRRLTSLSLKVQYAEFCLMSIETSFITEFSFEVALVGAMLPITRFDYNEALYVLSCMPNLEKCILRLENVDPRVARDVQPPPISHVVPLPKLRELTLLGMAQPRGMATMLVLPALRSLTMIHTTSFPEEGYESPLVEWAGHHGEHLTYFAFDYLCLTQNALRICLEKVKNVKELRMIGPAYIGNHKIPPNNTRPLRPHALLNAEVMKWLTPPEGADQPYYDYCCPKLETLWITMGSLEQIEGPLTDMIAARRRTLGARPLIQKISACISYEKRMDIMEALKRRGADMEGLSITIEYAWWICSASRFIDSLNRFNAV